MYYEDPKYKIAYFDGDHRAILINQFRKEYDLYDYRDMVDSEDEAIEELSRDIRSGNTGYIKDFLEEVIKETKLNIIEALSSIFSSRLVEQGLCPILYEIEENQIMRDRATDLLKSLS